METLLQIAYATHTETLSIIIAVAHLLGVAWFVCALTIESFTKPAKSLPLR
jgi:hypothetical protein